MLKKHLGLLCCPICHSDLTLDVAEQADGHVSEGSLRCSACLRSYPIIRSVPRFTLEPTNYTAGFGFQWNRHFKTQYDSYTGLSISGRRFLEETRWPRDLPGQLVLEAGSGSGRFTEHAAATGATVVSFDYSGAVEANFRNNGHLENVLILQASIYQMPFREASFDKVFCIGVLQHTPSPDEAFGCLARVLKAGGNLVVDAYRIRPWYEMIFLTKYWVRPVTRRLPPEKLYRFCETWVRLWWKPTGYFVRLTGRRTLSWFLLIADYRGVYPLPDSIQQEWSILDTFDMLSPAYDYPQTLSSVRAWFEGERFVEIDVCYGFNGIEGRGNKA